ncbi:MAG TPA: YkgJ family cysteine cluster protein [Rhodocyclaceae bacterium]|nr:YkgJ family cysteine cluster protein [Rhodocyclaceae bacterium]
MNRICRPGCGACCIAPSISSAIPGMAGAKPAGLACAQLTADFACAIFGRPQRPRCCAGLSPSREMCGDNREQALAYLDRLERLTAPA